MANYKFRYPTALYKTDEGSYISQKTLTDEIAEKFLAEDPERIALFSSYPDSVAPQRDDIAPEVIEDTEPENSENKPPCTPCKKKKELMAINMNELRVMYPDFSTPVGTTKVDFVNMIVKSIFNTED